MEMGRHSVVFGILTTVLVFADSKRQCNYQSNCDRSLQFCDEVTGRCTSCGSFPCAESTMKEQGDGWCRKICPEYWKNHLSIVDTTTLPLTSSPGQYREAEKMVQNFETEKGDEERNKDATQNNAVYILVGVLGSAGMLAAAVGTIMYAKRFNRIRKPKEEENRDHADEPMVGPQPFRQHGPIAQDEGGV